MNSEETGLVSRLFWSMQIRSLKTIGCHGYGDMVFLVQKCMATWPLQYNKKTQVCVFLGAVD